MCFAILAGFMWADSAQSPFLVFPIPYVAAYAAFLLWLRPPRNRPLILSGGLLVGGWLISLAAWYADDFRGFSEEDVLVFHLLGWALMLAGGMLLSMILVQKKSNAHISQDVPSWDLSSANTHPLAEQAYFDLVGEAHRMRRLSFFSLVGVAAIIVLAVLIILFAGLITNIDLRSTNTLSLAADDVDAARSSLDRSFSEENDAQRKLEVLLLKAENTAGNLKDQEVFDITINQIPAARAELNKADFEYTNARNRLEEAEAFLKQLRDRAVGIDGTDATGNSETQALIASAVTRFGVIAIMMFFAQALINLYRYALTLSASLKSRALALLLARENLTNLGELSEILSQDHLTLGRAPVNPIGDAKKLAEIAKDLKSG